MFHHFKQSIKGVDLPKQFTYPFQYEPHPLAVMAADEVRRYLLSQTQWQDELSHGKMFGVLVVVSQNGEVGFLSAFSGQLAGTYQHEFFVPPIYDLAEPAGFFREEEHNISLLNEKINTILSSEEYCFLLNKEKEMSSQLIQLTADWKQRLMEAKSARDACRRTSISEEDEQRLVRESQFLKAEFKRQKDAFLLEIERVKCDLRKIESQLDNLKLERKTRSAALQERLFEQFVLCDAQGESRSLLGIFRRVGHPIPPSGAGECAAPKLLQYAYQNHFKPLCMAEFWWGESPKSIVRIHGHYYPACKSKCEPILHFMLQGLDVEPSPIQPRVKELSLEIVWEDEHLLVVNKPSGILSVPGKQDSQSVYSFVKNRYPDATGPLIVHRLDMATSGLIIVAKTKEAHCALQRQFNNHLVRKRYLALLQGVLTQDSGSICLPICPDVDHRPCQMVSEKYGKYALTEYEVVSRDNGVTKVYFYPLTGRTHQLRLHSAHPDGLGMPIIGDELYGSKSDRLYLQAQRIEFEHPLSGQRLCVEIPPEF